MRVTRYLVTVRSCGAVLTVYGPSNDRFRMSALRDEINRTQPSHFASLDRVTIDAGVSVDRPEVRALHSFTSAQ